MPEILLCVVALVVGVVTDVTTAAAVAAAVACASLVVVPWPRVRRWLIVAVVAAIGMAHGARAREAALDAPVVVALGPLLDDRTAPPVWIEGVLHDDAAVEDGSAVLALDITRVRVDLRSDWRDVEGRASLGVGGTNVSVAARQWTRGRLVRAPALLKRPQIWLNEGGPSERWQRLRRNADVSGSVKSSALVDVTPAGPIAELAARIRREVRTSTKRWLAPMSPRSAAVVAAILIGDRTGLDAVTIRNLQQAGTYHVIAISGGNIAIVAGFVLLLARLLWRRLVPALVATLIAVVAYGWIVGDQASVERAVIAAAVFLVGQLLGWMLTPLRVLAATALIVLVIDPMTSVDAGAWLSFGATAGILLFAGRFMSVASGIRNRVVLAAVALFAATASAELALAPVSADVFSRVGVAGLVLNFVAIPAMAVVQFAGTAMVIASRAAPPVARVAAWIAHYGVQALVGSARTLEFVPWLSWQTPPVWIGWTIVFYAALLFAANARGNARVMAVSASLAAVCLIVIVVPIPPAPSLAPGWLRIAMLDVGQGDSIALQFPTGQSMLIDSGGSATNFDISARVIQPALWALGLRRLDWLAITHGDVDHAGGAAGVLRDMWPREIWEGVPVPSDARMQRLRAAAVVRGAAWKRLIAGDSIEVGSAAIDVLSPVAPDWERRQTRNDDSIVLRLRFGDVSVLFTGDAGQTIENQLAFDRNGPPRLRLVKVAHHGSRTSSSPALLHDWLPQMAFVSVGRGNTFGHPAPEVMARYDKLGIDMFRTDLDGEVIIETDGKEVRVRTATGRRWRLTAAGR